MGRKTDANLCHLTDAELASLDTSRMDAKSVEAVSVEISERRAGRREYIAPAEQKWQKDPNPEGEVAGETWKRPEKEAADEAPKKTRKPRKKAD